VKHIGTLSGVVLLLIGIFFLPDYLTPPKSSIPKTDQVPQVETAEAAPHNQYAFSLATIDGKPLKLADYHGQVTLVNFWATWCGPCRLETPALVRMYKKYGDRGFVVIGVAVQSEEDEVKEFVREFSVPYATGIDTDSEVAARYGLFAVPTSFLFSAEGKLLRTFTGFVREGELEEQLQILLKKGETEQAAVN
jgi:thiol-disulfide isomerase/thioredoxin